MVDGFHLVGWGFDLVVVGDVGPQIVLDGDGFIVGRIVGGGQIGREGNRFGRDAIRHLQVSGRPCGVKRARFAQARLVGHAHARNNIVLIALLQNVARLNEVNQVLALWV